MRCHSFFRPSVAVATAAALTLGCFDFVAMPAAAPAPSAAPSAKPLSVRIALTPAGSEKVRDPLGPFIVTVEGALQSAWPADSVTVQVFTSFHQTGYRAAVPGVSMTLARGDVATMERKQLNVLRTTMAGLLIGGAMVAVPAAIQATGGGSINTGGGTAQP
jgi:hypothetical protein